MAQLLYDLGIEDDDQFLSIHGPLQPTPPGTVSSISVPWPPMVPLPPKKSWDPPQFSLYAPLPLCLTAAPPPVAALAARSRATTPTLSNKEITSQTVTNYLIGPHDMEMIYMSHDPYG